ncbi:GNAT family N-acetyltransferase [Pseudomonas fragi]|uniref:GNAT family N-acetyltransferase n=1 Tax=Pseudomonas fragi TaxID=296 RepID=UPI00087AF1C5|nr:GNAT family N-acetyltransferase [Pseudomonas fragi]MDE4514646.1 N-acetyltransferase [Pseudomonas fragi]QPC36937.1 GNAT family N-acetyltransferase [Pseudomonas fragi]SDU30552.1 Acetyltransferase (GNAT) family protein [Pseudomonas fragi]
MTAIIYAPLEAVLWPLMNKFYRAHQSSMKAVRDAQLWVARQEEIIAGLCLRPMAHGYWLTGLFVAPGLRGQGVAGALVSQAVAASDGPVWLFCDPQLQDFYEKLGFSLDVELPHALHERLVRYQRNKAMIAMGLTPWCLAPDQETAPQ